MKILNDTYLNEFIKNSLNEDIGDGDHSSLACIPKQTYGTAQLIVKEKGVFAGLEVANKLYNIVDERIEFKPFVKDGDIVKPGNIAFTIKGEALSILKTERLMLNVLQRMSGIATQTRKYVDKLSGLKTKILDTRKTTPGMRILEKAAVKIGGGTNHRMGLFDMIMLKDNHIDFAGGIEKAIDDTNEYLKKTGKNLKIEIEARNLNDVDRILKHGKVDIIMLDNFTIEDTKEAVKRINSKIITESSGNITLNNIRDYAKCGVDYISVGALTHQIKSLDLSLKAKI